MTNFGSTEYTQEFDVINSFGITRGENVEGIIACTTSGDTTTFLNQIDAAINQQKGDVLLVLPGEFGYSGPEGVSGMTLLVDEGVVFSGILTFGRYKYGAQGSHFSIVARELEIPLCLAKRPWQTRFSWAEAKFIKNNPIAPLNGHIGRLTLDGDGDTAKLVI